MHATALWPALQFAHRFAPIAPGRSSSLAGANLADEFHWIILDPTFVLVYIRCGVIHLVVSDFDWDEENHAHIARHKVTPSEIEEVFRRRYALEISDPVDGEERFLAYGTTAGGRYLTVAFTEREGRIRPITTWTMTREEREQNADEIHE